MNDAERGLKLCMKYSVIFKSEALMLLSYLVTCSHCSWRWYLLSDIALFAWAVASVTLIYSQPLGEELIIRVQYSFGAAVFINTGYTKLCMSEFGGRGLFLGMPPQQGEGTEFTLPHTCCCLFLTSLLAFSSCRGQFISQELSKAYDFGNLPDIYLNNSQTEMLGFKLIFSVRENWGLRNRNLREFHYFGNISAWRWNSPLHEKMIETNL